MLQKIDTTEFVDTFREIWDSTDRRFCFVLGAGVSRSSGIKTGNELADTWLQEIQKRMKDKPGRFQKFVEDNEIDISKAGHHYPEIYKERFRLDIASGFEYINREMESARPGYGYSVLAQILAEKHHNIVITTNFDNLTEEALYTYTPKRPLVCGHESLAIFAKPSLKRPLIVKIHRDRFLSPQSMPEEIDSINKAWVGALNQIFQNCIPVFIGYGGNDGSMMGYLEEIGQFDNMFWCERKGTAVSSRVASLLDKHNGKLVEIEGFDELMFLLQDGLRLKLLLSEIMSIAEERAKKYKEAVEKIRESQSASPNKEAQDAAERLVEKAGDDWWAWELKAKSAKSVNERDDIYKEAIQALPANAELAGNYANFLSGFPEKYDAAERYYELSLKLDPADAMSNNNYAVFLKNIRNNYKAAETYYKLALGLDPVNVKINGNYAMYLTDISRQYNDACEYYERALDVDPYHANYNANYAGLLLYLGDQPKAMQHLTMAERYCDIEALKAEIPFYKYAHIADHRQESLNELKAAICSGIRSVGFNLKQNVDKAIKDGHPDPLLLQRLADIITKDAPIGDLCKK